MTAKECSQLLPLKLDRAPPGQVRGRRADNRDMKVSLGKSIMRDICYLTTNCAFSVANFTFS